MSRLRSLAQVLGLLLLPSLVAGCTSSPANGPTNDASAVVSPPDASSAPAPTCTPLTGTTAPYRCSQADFDALQAKAVEYAAAEKAYREYFALDNKQMRSGEPVSAEVRALLAGPMVARYEKRTADRNDVGMTTDRDAVLGYVRPSHVSLYEGSTIALDTCEDGSAVSAMDGTTPVMKLQIVKGHAYLTKVDGVYKMWWADGELVSSC